MFWYAFCSSNFSLLSLLVSRCLQYVGRNRAIAVFACAVVGYARLRKEEEDKDNATEEEGGGGEMVSDGSSHSTHHRVFCSAAIYRNLVGCRQ